MKKGWVILSLFLATSAFSAEILDGRFNQEKNAVELDVSIVGGCAKHSFSLDVGGCKERIPVQCTEVKLIEEVYDDPCNNNFQKMTILLPLHEAGLDDRYYKGATLTIEGSLGKKVKVTLP